MDRAAEPVDTLIIGKIERHQSGATAGRGYFVVQFLQPAGGAGERDDMGAGRSECLGGVVADAARGAGDQRNAPPSFPLRGLGAALTPRSSLMRYLTGG